MCGALLSSLLSAGEALPEHPSDTSLRILVGSRVRLEAPGVLPGRLQGTVIQIDEDSFLISAKGAAPVSVSRESVTRIEVHRGRRRHTLMGMGIGAGIGALAMGISPPVNEGRTTGFSGETALIGALAGGIEGAVVGALVRTDQWTTVPVNQVQISLAPTRGHGASLSMSIRF